MSHQSTYPATCSRSSALLQVLVVRDVAGPAVDLLGREGACLERRGRRQGGNRAAELGGRGKCDSLVVAFHEGRAAGVEGDVYAVGLVGWEDIGLHNRQCEAD
jgi:hypothetical protein